MGAELISGDKLKYLIEFTAERVISQEEKLNDLDKAIGDGDHGANMSRGCRSLLGGIHEIEYDSLANVLIFIGKTLISSIGGASGALYGTLFLHIGKNLNNEETFRDFLFALEEGVKEVMILGSSHVNQKTMLDVIVPVLELLKEQSITLTQIADKATTSSKLTIAMKAEKGRASYLGDRSIGFLDPGAYSSEVIICSICEALNNHE